MPVVVVANSLHLCILTRNKVSVRTFVRPSVTLGVASSVANDVIMRTAGLGAGCQRRRREPHERRHNENDVTMTIAGLWRYGDWRHVATGCNAQVVVKHRVEKKLISQLFD